MRGSRVAVAVVLSVVPARAAQELLSERPWPFEITQRAFEGNRQAGYLAAVLDLLGREAEARASEELKPLYLDLLATHLALVGEHERAMRAGDEAYGAVQRRGNAAADPDALKGHRPVDAIETIVAHARGRKLVMVNEEHRSSIQRAFTNRLLAPLWKVGFRYLAVETLAEDPRTSTGPSRTLPRRDRWTANPCSSSMRPGPSGARPRAPSTRRSSIRALAPKTAVPGPTMVMAALMLITFAATIVIPTAALVLLMAPIVLNTAAELGLSPHALMMAVAMAASSSFTSPVSHPANVLVMGPGGYRFGDYLKVGGALTAVVFVVTMVVLPWLWPLAAR